MPKLSTRALQGLKEYQYQSGGTTILDAAHDPVWKWLVYRLPMWLAPNLITLTGTMCIVTAYLLNIIYNPGFTGEAPTWVYLVTAASVALYVNLDCMDGKQARRTGSSSPLGQLFDHGCDALALHMMLANIAASLGVGCGWKMAAGCLGIMVPWMLAQWEEYHTGVMMYGNAFYGVLEANYSICAVHLLSAAFGLKLWRTEVPLPRPLTLLLGSLSSHHTTAHSLPHHLRSFTSGLLSHSPLNAARDLLAGAVSSGYEPNASVGNGYEPATFPPPPSPAPAMSAMSAPTGMGAAAEAAVAGAVQSATVAEIALVLVSVAGLLQGVSNVRRVFGRKTHMSAKDAGHKQVGRLWAFVHLIGMMVTMLLGASTVAMAGSASGNGAAKDGLFTWLLDHPCTECRATFSLFGLTYALGASQLIVAHMAKEPWVPSVIALLFPVVLVASGLLSGASEAGNSSWEAIGKLWGGNGDGGVPPHTLLLLGMHTVVVAVYLRYVVGITKEVCAFLGIKCLTIAPPPFKND